MNHELQFWLFVISIIGCGGVLGAIVGYFAGRVSMLNQIYGRRRTGILNRAKRRLQRAVDAASEPADILEAEVIQ